MTNPKVLASGVFGELPYAIAHYIYDDATRALLTSSGRTDYEWLCGYVGVPKGSKLAGLTFAELPEADVHGGLTYSRRSAMLSGVFKMPEDRIYWFGFDCNHLDDSIWVQDQTYVRGECEKLARQLSMWQR